MQKKIHCTPPTTFLQVLEVFAMSGKVAKNKMAISPPTHNPRTKNQFSKKIGKKALKEIIQVSSKTQTGQISWILGYKKISLLFNNQEFEKVERLTPVWFLEETLFIKKCAKKALQKKVLKKAYRGVFGLLRVFLS